MKNEFSKSIGTSQNAASARDSGKVANCQRASLRSRTRARGAPAPADRVNVQHPLAAHSSMTAAAVKKLDSIASAISSADFSHWARLRARVKQPDQRAATTKPRGWL